MRSRSASRIDLLRATTLGALLAAGGAGCLAAVVLPLSPDAPVRLVLTLGLLRLAAGGALLALRGRVPSEPAQAVALLNAVGSVVLVAQSHTFAGVVLASLGLPWLGLWAAAFLQPRRAAVLAGLMTTALGVGVAASDAPQALGAGAIVATATWAATLAFSVVAVHLRAQLHTDGLTGLLNRDGLRRAGERELAEAARRGQPLVVAALDLDGFKEINDTHGHAAGDRTLAEFGRAWIDGFGGEAVLGRHGGDEFVLVLRGGGLAEANALLRRLEAASTVRWTAGATAWHGGETFEDCLHRADAELYRHKRELRRHAA